MYCIATRTVCVGGCPECAQAPNIADVVVCCRVWRAHQAGHSSGASVGLGGSHLSTASQGRALSVPCVSLGKPDQLLRSA